MITIDSWNARLSSGILATMLGLLPNSLLAVAQETTTPHQYPQDAIAEILADCHTETEKILPPDVVEPLCQCVIAEFQAQLSYDEYQQLVEQAETEGDDPEVLAEIGEECAVNAI
ncbi:hypothetical protein [Roseofilum casamattae]|uniref:Uncharacterized protein n=1 Tax=Roseofilum casamattae BLCC-M143 TaxID=3022442 RepID=A0ABT7C028_9CYAN|nr:hypothetical protein [Roseofilum casamattae]MDJ1184815.1 hypothetical protein [Roseofilum casamattae BLCC-M143]